MEKNVGTVDAIIRITLGLTGLSWGISRMARDPYRTSPIIVSFLSAMKVAEGITRFCPMLAVFNESTIEKTDQNNTSGYMKHPME